MKTVTATFAALLLAGASSAALAQDRDHDRGDRGQGQPHAQQAPQGPPAGQARAPAAPAARSFERPGGAEHDRGGQRFQNQSPGTPAPQAGPQRFERGPGPNAAPDRRFDHERGPREVTPPGASPAPAPQRFQDRGPDRNWDGRRDGRDGQRIEGARPGDGRDWRGGDNRPGDHRFDGSRDGRPGDGRDWRGGDHRDDHRGGPSPWRRGDHWQAGHAPPVFWSQNRFRIGSYRPPYGYYVRTWGYGDILPRGWYAQDYWLDDFLDYDLPYPPPGYEWVRVGGDALMIDRYTGRIVQVVRGIFW